MNSLMGYESVKQLAKQRRCNIPDLLAMAQNRDPFYIGSETQRAQAEWFAELWTRFGYTSGIHLRRIHYQLVSQHNPTRQDGTPYENTESCWDYLGNAGRFARYLDLVDPEGFEDHRNPDPSIFARPMRDVERGFIIEPPAWTLPEIVADLDIDLTLPAPWVIGYDYDLSDQPYHIELWVEKSTMDDVLLPVCAEFGLNLVTSLGFQSITSVIELLRRARASGKPVRVLYISDFDPAGDKMPVAVARQLEYWRPIYAPATDVKLTPLVLTAEQVRAYRLPRKFVKDTDLRKAGFEALYGPGQVELDALEALYPGALAEIVRQAVQTYQDEELPDRLGQAETEATASVDEAWQEATRAIRPEVEAIADDARAIVERYREQFDALAQQLTNELEPVQARLDVVRQAVQDAIDTVEAELPYRPDPFAEPGSESGWLFDAGRDYMAQLAIYKARQSRDGNGKVSR